MVKKHSWLLVVIGRIHEALGLCQEKRWKNSQLARDQRKQRLNSFRYFHEFGWMKNEWKFSDTTFPKCFNDATKPKIIRALSHLSDLLISQLLQNLYFHKINEHLYRMSPRLQSVPCYDVNAIGSSKNYQILFTQRLRATRDFPDFKAIFRRTSVDKDFWKLRLEPCVNENRHFL